MIGRAARVSALLLTLVALGCDEGQQVPQSREDLATMALTSMSRRIKAAHPLERIVVNGAIYCGFPNYCRASDGGDSWLPGVLDGALKELGANVVQGHLRAPLARSGVDLVVAFGPIRTIGPDRADLVVRYERRGGTIISRVSMTATSTDWRVAAETTISTATYVYPPYVDTRGVRKDTGTH